MKKILVFTLFLSTLLFAFMTDGGLGNGNISLRGYMTEAKIYGRLAKSQQDGIFSKSGLLGRCYEANQMWGTGLDKPPDYQIKEYDQGRCSNYLMYESQSGMQALIYFLIDKIYHSPVVFRFFCALFLSVVIASWLMWISHYFGVFTAFFTCFGILSLRGLVIYGDNIAQILGATYLIMVVMFWCYQKGFKWIREIVFSVVLLKFLLNGPEFLFCALILPYIPLVFYGVLNSWPYQKFKKDTLLTTQGLIASCLAAVLILFSQIYSATGSFYESWHHFIERSLERTYFPANPIILKQMNGISAWHLFLKYLNFKAINAGSFYVTFLTFILFLFLISLVALYLSLKRKQKALLALLITTWFSLLCPVSWIFLAREHAVFHQFMDPIVWHMPFTLLGLALIGATLRQGCLEIWGIQKIRK